MKTTIFVLLAIICVLVGFLREYQYEARILRRRCRKQAKRIGELEFTLGRVQLQIEPDFDPELAEYQGDAPR